MSKTSALPKGGRARTLRRLRLVSMAGALALVASACLYLPAWFPLTPLLSECNGVPATIGVGWVPEDGAVALAAGTPGDDVVVITNGPVLFAGGGGDDLICINDTGMADGPMQGPDPDTGREHLIVLFPGEGNDTVYNFADKDVLALLGPAGNNQLPNDEDTYHGGDGLDEVHSGGGVDTLYLGGGDDYAFGSEPGELIDCGPGIDTVTSGLHQGTEIDCEIQLP